MKDYANSDLQCLLKQRWTGQLASATVIYQNCENIMDVPNYFAIPVRYTIVLVDLQMEAVLLQSQYAKISFIGLVLLMKDVLCTFAPGN